MEQQERLGALFAGRCFAALAGVVILGLWPDIYGVGVAVLALLVGAVFSWLFALGRMSMGSDPKKVAAIHGYVDVVLALGCLLVVASLTGRIVTLVMVFVLFFAFLALPYRRSGIPLADRQQWLWMADVLVALLLLGVLFWSPADNKMKLIGLMLVVLVTAVAVLGQMRINRRLNTPEPAPQAEEAEVVEGEAVPFDPEDTQQMKPVDVDA
jgi:hypothetical protein